MNEMREQKDKYIFFKNPVVRLKCCAMKTATARPYVAANVSSPLKGQPSESL